jgi:pyruvate dehydrogenase E1 component alpha subunit
VSQGVLLETFNLAALWRIPVIFICENNGWSTTMRTEDTVAGSITGRAEAFGIPARTVDGIDPEVVAEATAEAVERARSGGGPSFVECLAYRFDAHHTFEHVVRPRYRTEEEIAAGSARDPVEIQGARLDPLRREAIDAEIEDLLEDAVRFAGESPPPDPAGALDHLYADGIRTRTGVG